MHIYIYTHILHTYMIDIACEHGCGWSASTLGTKYSSRLLESSLRCFAPPLKYWVGHRDPSSFPPFLALNIAVVASSSGPTKSEVLQVLFAGDLRPAAEAPIRSRASGGGPGVARPPPIPSFRRPEQLGMSLHVPGTGRRAVHPR